MHLRQEVDISRHDRSGRMLFGHGMYDQSEGDEMTDYKYKCKYCGLTNSVEMYHQNDKIIYKCLKCRSKMWKVKNNGKS